MDRSPRTTVALRQRPLRFPTITGRVEPWDSLTERQQQECRQALRQMLVAVVLYSRDAIDDHPGPTDQDPEKCTNE